MDSKVKIIRDSGKTDIGCIDARYPYFRLRGKRVTPEQAFEVIKRSDAGLEYLFPNGSRADKEHIHYSYILNTRFFGGSSFPNNYGWCRPNGIVGINDIVSKNPMEYEVIPELTYAARAFPFVDFVIAVTDWDEKPPYISRLLGEIDSYDFWDNDDGGEAYWNYDPTTDYIDIYNPDNLRKYFDNRGCNSEDIERYTKIVDNRDKLFSNLHDWVRNTPEVCKEHYIDYPDFLDHVQLGYWVHDGMLEILNADRAKALYSEYDSKYSEMNKDVYSVFYYTDRKVNLIPPDYLKRIMEYYGLYPRN